MSRPDSGETLNLHAELSSSRSNGPGTRYVIWLQGCTLGCVGCFNPETHRPEHRYLVTVSELMARIRRDEPRLEGITVSGGEPLQQPRVLLRLLRTLRHETQLTTLLFSGFDLAEIEHIHLGRAILDELDVLIAGRYQRENHLGAGLRGSSNQRIHLLTERYTVPEIETTPEDEIHIEPGGKIVITGVGGISVRT